MSDGPSRRRFLTLGLGFSALAAVGWQFWGRRPLAGAPAEPVALDPARFRTLLAAFEVFLGDRAAAERAARAVDLHLAGPGRDQAKDLALALAVLEFAPRGLRSARFSRLADAERAEVLRAWSRSGWVVRRQIAGALRKAARFTHFAHDDTWHQLGYEGTWVGRDHP